MSTLKSPDAWLDVALDRAEFDYGMPTPGVHPVERAVAAALRKMVAAQTEDWRVEMSRAGWGHGRPSSTRAMLDYVASSVARDTSQKLVIRQCAVATMIGLCCLEEREDVYSPAIVRSLRSVQVTQGGPDGAVTHTNGMGGTARGRLLGLHDEGRVPVRMVTLVREVLDSTWDQGDAALAKCLRSHVGSLALQPASREPRPGSQAAKALEVLRALPPGTFAAIPGGSGAAAHLKARYRCTLQSAREARKAREVVPDDAIGYRLLP